MTKMTHVFKMFSGQGARSLKAWLENKVETARSNKNLGVDLSRRPCPHEGAQNRPHFGPIGSIGING